MGHRDNKRVESLLSQGKKGPEETRIRCPFCEDDGHFDRKFSLGANERTGWWQCFRCERKGRLPGYQDEDVEDEEWDDGPLTDGFDPPSEYVPLYEDDYWHSISFSAARAYLESRYVTQQLAQTLQIGACDEGFWCGRIIIPHLIPGKARWQGWCARLWGAKASAGLGALPYLYPRGMDRGRWWYNHAALLEETDAPVIATEGAFKVFPYYPDAVGSFGKPTEEQVAALMKSKRPVAVVLDGDAWEEGWMLAEKLRFSGVPAGHVRLPPKTDPDDVDRKWLIREAARCIRDPGE